MKFVILILIAMVSCMDMTYAFSKKAPKVDPPPAPVATPTPTPKPSPAPISTSKSSLEDIKKIAAGSKCAKYNFKNRGPAPAGYMKGMALSFAKSLCRPVPTISTKVGGSGDALKQYEQIFKDLGMSNNQGLEAHRHVWAILIGLGMRETSGQYCGGRDLSADFTSSNGAEAGLFQTSYNVISYKAESSSIYKAYKNDQSKCLLDVYKEGVPQSYCDKNAKNWGSESDEGYKYQKLVKQCPALSAETAAVTIRFSGGPAGHYGPLRERAAEVKPDCDQMLIDVQSYVETHVDICKQM